MKSLKKIFLLILFFQMFSCEKEIAWKIKNDNRDVLVVDGILTNEMKPQHIRLTHSIQELNAPQRPFMGASVVVTDSVHSYVFAEAVNDPGNYISEPFRALVGRNYYLTIQTDTSLFQAMTNAVPVNPLEDIELKKDKNSSLYSYVYTENTTPSMLEVNYNWSADTSYCLSYGFCQASETFYSLNNVDVNKAFSPEKVIIWFPKGTIIIRKKYSLTEEHQQFLRSLLMETEWRGGIFDVQQGNVETNLTNGALGFFAACMVLSDTTMVE
jgi:hypothetical protein